MSTDKDGRFTIDHLLYGTYQTFSIHEADAYSIDNQSFDRQKLAEVPLEQKLKEPPSWPEIPD